MAKTGTAKQGAAKVGYGEADTDGPRLWLVLARAYGSMAAYVEQSIAAQGLGLSDFMVLEVLLHKGPQAISAIGEKVLLANASMTAAIDRLEKRGLVAREASGQDRRSKLVTLTREGRTLIAEAYAKHAEDIEGVTSSLSDKERTKLRSLLKTLGLAARAATERGKQEAAGATKAAKARG